MKIMTGFSRYLPVGALGVSLFVHLAIFLFIGSVVIIEAVKPKTIFVAGDEPVPLQDIPAVPELPDNSPELEPDKMPVEENTVSAADFSPVIETISSNAAVTLPAYSVAPPTMAGGNGVSSATLQANSSEAKHNVMSNVKISPFGSSDITAGGLEGYFYDLKQTKNGKTTGMDISRWEKFLRGFANSNWNTDALNGYYRSPAPLYIQQFYISTKASVDGPKAFGLKDVKPDMWLALYSGMVVAPEDGNYTFCGYGDDVLLVRINGRLVLDAGWLTITNEVDFKTYPALWSKVYRDRGCIRIGKTFKVTAGKPMKMEVLISDRGGWCSFFLFLRKEGVEYIKLGDGTPRLPIFQLRQQAINAEGEVPPNSGKGVLWDQPNSDENPKTN